MFLPLFLYWVYSIRTIVPGAWSSSPELVILSVQPQSLSQTSALQLLLLTTVFAIVSIYETRITAICLLLSGLPCRSCFTTVLQTLLPVYNIQCCDCVGNLDACRSAKGLNEQESKFIRTSPDLNKCACPGLRQCRV